MTIMKTIALAALTGTLALGPQAVFAQSTEHGKSDAAHSRNDARKSEQATAKADREAARDAAKAERDTANETRAEERAAAKQDRAAAREYKVNFGQVISTIRTGGDLSEISGLTGDVDVTVIDIDSVTRGNNRVALENALRDVNETELRDTLAANSVVADALNAEGVALDTVVFADVNANGDLVVITQ